MKIQATTLNAYRLLHDGILAFARAERAGMRIDTDYCERKKTFLTKKIKRLEDQLMQTKFIQHWRYHCGIKFNINSNFQLAHILYNVRKMKPDKTTVTGKGATDDETLRQLGIPEMKLLLEMRKLTKVRDTYLKAFTREQINGVLHPFFNLHTVRTYRSSSDSPNFQNIPKRDEESMRICRRAILPRPGHQLAEADFSGIEVRISACYHEDPRLIQDVLHGDMHRDMAIELYMLDSLDKHHPGEANLRQGGKNGFVFPEFYGDYYGNCARGLLEWAERAYLKDGTPALEHMAAKRLIVLASDGSVKSFDKFTEHVRHVEDDFWNVRYKIYTAWKKHWWAQYQRRGYLDMLTGFRCSGVLSRNDAINYPIQGSAFHCLLWTFIEVDRIMQEEKWDSRLIGQIHDSMSSDVAPNELKHFIKTVHQVACEELPKAWPWIIVPLDIDVEVCEIDRPWSEKKPIKLENLLGGKNERLRI